MDCQESHYEPECPCADGRLGSCTGRLFLTKDIKLKNTSLQSQAGIFYISSFDYKEPM